MENRTTNIRVIAAKPRSHAPRVSNSAGIRGCDASRLRHHRGGAVLDAILVLPVLLTLALGAAEYGYAFYLKHNLQAAAAVGVRTAILPNSTDAQVQSAVSQQLALTNMQNLQYTLTTSPSTMASCPSGTFVTVTISCTWGNVGISPLSAAMGGIASTKQISAAAAMVHE